MDVVIIDYFVEKETAGGREEEWQARSNALEQVHTSYIYIYGYIYIHIYIYVHIYTYIHIYIYI